MERQRPKAPRICFWIMWSAFTLLFVPVLYMSLKSVHDPFSESGFTLKWYIQVFQDRRIWEALGRSLTVAAVSSLISCVLALIAALALLKSSFQLKKALESFSLVSLVLPELVFALSLLSWFFLLTVDLSLFTVTISHVSFTLAFALMVLKTRVQKLETSLEEAASDLGAREHQILRRILLPQMIPAIASAFLLSFLLSFDDFLITFFTNGVGSDTLPVQLYSSLKMGLSPKMTALSTLMLLFSAFFALIFLKFGGLQVLTQQASTKKSPLYFRKQRRSIF